MAEVSRSGSFDELEAQEPYPGLVRRTFDSEKATVNSYAFEPGATFPQHHHPQEQVTLIEKGAVELTVAGETTTLGEGSWSVIPGGIEHGITAGPDGARIVAMIVPRRESADAYELADDS